MKKLLMTFATLLLAMSVSAQQYQNVSDTPFNKGKMYASAGFSGLDLNYNSTTKWNLNIDGKVTTFVRTASTLALVLTTSTPNVTTISCPMSMWAMLSSSAAPLLLSLNSTTI